VSLERVAAVIPTIPPRTALLQEAIASVLAQTHPAAAISVAVDVDREGAWATRQRALQATSTPWVAFLDDDDRWRPEHLQRLLAHAAATGADFVFPWFTLDLARGDPLGHFGLPFDPERPHLTTITVLVRGELARRVGFTPPPEGGHGNEDWRFLLGCLAEGAHVEHLPERTWDWRHHAGNTTGWPDRW
jgi:glycosyltransferase involved in cell wall biosynthesis